MCCGKRDSFWMSTMSDKRERRYWDLEVDVPRDLAVTFSPFSHQGRRLSNQIFSKRRERRNSLSTSSHRLGVELSQWNGTQDPLPKRGLSSSWRSPLPCPLPWRKCWRLAHKMVSLCSTIYLQGTVLFLSRTESIFVSLELVRCCILDL